MLRELKRWRERRRIDRFRSALGAHYSLIRATLEVTRHLQHRREALIGGDSLSTPARDMLRHFNNTTHAMIKELDQEADLVLRMAEGAIAQQT
jgi:hypothetical protein